MDDCNDSICHENATCSNFEGGYNCMCDAGFTGDGMFCEREVHLSSNGMQIQRDM